jgi:predicted O-methyltransferase YrrM
MIKYSLVLPTRGRPDQFLTFIKSAFELAKDPDSVEVIARLDDDDKTIPEYVQAISKYKNTTLLFGPRMGGYFDNHKLTEECVMASTGDRIVQFNDDAEFLSLYWDKIWNETFHGWKVYVGSSIIIGGGGYRFSFPVVPRCLYKAVGIFAPCASIDRTWAVVSKKCNCEVKTPVKIAHHHWPNDTKEPTAVEGGMAYGNWARHNRKAFQREHWDWGRKYAEIIKTKVKKGDSMERQETLDKILNLFHLKEAHHQQQLYKFTRDDFAGMLRVLGMNTGAEIGVFQGVYSETLLAANPKLKLYSIDPWLADPPTGVDEKQIQKAFAAAMNRLGPYKNSYVIRKKSAEAVHQFSDRSLDFVYIDGAHDFDSCYEDLSIWSPKVKTGGIIAGHDYNYYSSPYGKHYGVIEAVNTYVYQHQITPMFTFGRRWRKPYVACPMSFMWVNP